MSDRDGLAGSDEAVEAVPVRDSAAHELAVELNAEVQAGGHTDRAKALIQMLVEASAEAVAEERQRIEAVLNGCDLFAADAPYNAAAWQLRGDLLAAAGSVPVATPEPANPTCEHGRTGAHPVDPTATQMFWRDYPLYCPGPVATPAEPPPGSDAAYALQGRLQATNHLVALLHGRSDPCRCPDCDVVAPIPPPEPSVGTGTPAEQCGCTACTPDGPIDGKCRCDVCIRSAIWHPESTCTCRLCRHARSLHQPRRFQAAAGTLSGGRAW